MLISDVETFHSSFLGYYLKISANRYPFLAEIKGSSMQIRTLNIIVTSDFKIVDKSLFVAVYRVFDKVYISDQGSLEIIKRETCEPNHQFISVL